MSQETVHLSGALRNGNDRLILTVPHTSGDAGPLLRLG